MNKCSINIDFSNSNVDKTKPYISISNVLGLLDKPFDQQAVAQKTHDSNYDNVNSKYYHMTVEEIIESWSAKGAESCRYGSLLDDYIGLRLTGTEDDIELYKLDNNFDYDNRLHNLCSNFEEVYNMMSKSGDLEFVDRERSVYFTMNANTDDEYNVIGRFDALFYNKKTNKWIVVDWKSSGNIEKNNKYKKLLGPAMKLDACNWNTYTIQTHFYKKALIESKYLPEGTTEDDVEVLIVHMPGTTPELHKQAFPYNSVFMEQIFSFAFRKNKLLNKQ